MNFAFSEEQEQLRSVVRQWLAERSPSNVVRALMETERGYEPAMWAEMARMGWLGMAIPREYGGAGFGHLELTVLFEEMGRSLLPAPFLSTIALAAPVILKAGSEDQKQKYLGPIAAGEMTVALALTEPNGRWGEDGVEAEAERTDGGWRLNGIKSFVIDGHTADVVVVAARVPDGVGLFIVGGDAGGLSRRLLNTMDPTRKLAEITLTDVVVDDDQVLESSGSSWSTIENLIQRAIVYLAAEQVGGASQCLDMAVEYAKTRHQFGRPIGSFQAIKHKCADMYVQVESARSACYFAAWAASRGSDDLAVAAPLAKSYCSEAYFQCASENIQIHGGVGFTWEHDAHLHFRRAKTSELLFGTPAHHRARLPTLLGI